VREREIERVRWQRDTSTHVVGNSTAFRVHKSVHEAATNTNRTKVVC